MTQVIRYWLLSNDVKQRVENYIQKSIESWAIDWGLKENGSWQVFVEPCEHLEVNDISHLSLRAQSKDRLILGLYNTGASSVIRQMISQVNQPIEKSLLMDSVLHDCQTDLVNKILLDCIDYEIISYRVNDDSDLGKNDINNLFLLQVNRQSINLKLIVSMQFIDIIMNRQESDESLEKLGRLSPRNTAISSEMVRVKVHYGDTELSIKEVSEIDVGDVIRLDQLISQAVSISDTNNHFLFKGLLGKQGNSFCVQVVNEEN